ncbi:MAG: class I SAM-dependent methyltransferase [Porticoccaceae bacterium]
MNARNDSVTHIVDDRALLELGRVLQQKGYCFTTVTPATHGRNLERRERAQTLRDIFGWSKPFERSLLMDSEFELARRAGILERHAHGWRSAVRWSTLDGLLVAHSAYPTENPDDVFFGPDTYRFVRLIKDFLSAGAAIGRAVDVGCGSGAAALVIARRRPDAEVVAVDINPLALRLAAVNARLASITNIGTKLGDMLNDVHGNFDLIVANPPFMMDSASRKYRDGGGALGAEISLRIVETALARLNRRGTLLLYTGVAIVDGKDLFLQTIERFLAAHDCSWHYEEIDPDVFSEELATPAYKAVERIAVVGLRLTLR